jgi:lycopene beta-cyclase
MYVLPLSATEALVEDTYFSHQPHPVEVYVEAIKTFLGERHGVTQFDTAYSEHGVIPMTTAEPSTPATPSPRIYALGLRGGLAKPSTGYAFLAIQRHAAELARRLSLSDLPPPPRPRSRRAHWLDGVFLSHLERFPEHAPDLFATLFERAPVDALVRFLSERSSIADDLSVMAALPARPFVREALHVLRGATLLSRS